MEGLIFGAICVAWLIYLVPWFLSSRGQTPVDIEPVPADLSRSSMTIVRVGESLADATPGEATVSTPLTRRAAKREARRIKQTAAMQRRRLLLGLVVMLVVVGVLAGFGVLQWTWLVAPGVMLVMFFVGSPISVKVVRRRADRLLASVDEDNDEETVAVKVVEVSPEDDVASVSLAPPVAKTGSLWEPIPVTAPTYMSQPLAARTVRTLDLSSPLAPPRYDVPVPQDAETDGEEGLRSTGA
ncbi:hypothetical protein [Propionicicella superfundia]|uniref:hypothetical protein n=1 Tax=Propionicicella superfundia TaxID=348582 RepID=UPI0004178EA6|nr:hypothetical protein [Propionicicella superfundia]